MKKFLSIYGIALFLFVTYLFLDDFRGVYYYLYKSDFSPMTLQKLLPKYCLSPVLMLCIYMIVLVGIILTIIFKETHIIATIGNLIISVPIFMVHKDTLFFEPFYFMYSYSHCINILRWVWYIYLSIFGGIMLAIYLFANSSKRTAQQKKIIKRIIKITCVSILVMAVAYASQCLYLSFKTYYLVNFAYDTNGEYSQELEDTISERNFKMLDDRRYHDKEDNDFQCKNTFPISLVFFKQARSWYWYDRIKMNLYFPKIISFELKNFRWVVTDVYEHP